MYVNPVDRSEGSRSNADRATMTCMKQMPLGEIHSVGVGDQIERARRGVGLTHRGLALETGISEVTLSRITSEKRAPKTTELVAIARATGTTVTELMGMGCVTERVQCSSQNAHEARLREKLLYFFELDAYLEDQVIASTL